MKLTRDDVDTTLAVVLADDLNDQLRTASTLPPPAMKGYVEAPWRGLVVTGYVELPDGVVTHFAAENAHGIPVRVSDTDVPAAIEQLVVAARELYPEHAS